MPKTRTFIAILALPLTLAACNRSGNMTNASVTNMGNSVPAEANITAIAEDQDSLPQSNAAGIDVSQWIGRWTGPEGLFLDIEPAAEGHYTLTIKDTLDGQGRYAGTATATGITFTRKGKAENIRPGTGAQTGFKYLMEKQECLIVQPGKEGYCR